MKIILNEKEILDKSLEQGYIDNKPSITIKLLAKHFFSIGQNKNQVIDSIDNFMEKYQKNYNFMDWQKVIKRIVNKTSKLESFEFVNITSVEIYQEELEEIKKIDNLRLEKLAFVLLVYSKIYNQMNKNEKNWVNSSIGDIFSDTKMAVSKKNQCLMINKLSDMKLLEVSKKVDCTNIKVLFTKYEGNKKIDITDFRDFIYEYLRWNGEKIGVCEGENCGRLIKITNNRQKYCPICWKERHQELKNKWKRENWNNKKEEV